MWEIVRRELKVQQRSRRSGDDRDLKRLRRKTMGSEQSQAQGRGHVH